MQPIVLLASLALCLCAGLTACGGADSAPSVEALAMPANAEPRLAAAATTQIPATGAARVLPQPWEESP
jgi:hypothetical protein